MPHRRFTLGVDIGQANDFSALVGLERVGEQLQLRHLERLPLGTSYPDQVERIRELATAPQLHGDVLVAVDGTGVGRAVVDLLRTALRPSRTPLVSVTITGGTATSRMGGRWSVPKRDLVGAAQVALQQRTLRVAAALPLARTLTDELVAYRVKVSEDGRDTYGNGRDAPHDDLVLATAIGVYAATAKRHSRRSVFPVGEERREMDPVMRTPDIVVG